MDKKTAVDVANEFKAKQQALKDKATPPETDPNKPDVKATENKPLETKDSKSALESAEKQAEADKVILETPEDKLTADQKTRKVELAKIADKANKPSAGKVIDDLQKELRTLKVEVEKSAEDKKRIAALEAQIKTLQETVSKPANTKKQDDELVKREKDRTDKYLSEDKDLPREERREMSKDELEDWFIEDPTAAQEFITKKVLRRDRERREDLAALTNKNKAADIIKAQEISQAKVTAKHPDLDVRGRFAQLKAEGKSYEEAAVIVQKENPTGFEKAKLFAEIVKEDEDKYFLAPNGPELLMEEMERRLTKAKPVKTGETETERDARIAAEAIEAEELRKASIDNPLKSSGGKKPEIKETETYKKGLEIYLAATKGKKTEADYKKILERRKGIPGAYQD